jgi:Flp pilus assembly protein TadG
MSSGRRAAEDGAILVHTAVALVGLILFTGFVVDYGTFWLARTQAQTSADAAALSGAWARIRDDASSPPASNTSGVVFDAAAAVAARNVVWGIAPSSDTLTLDWTCPDDGSTNCVAVDLYRDGTHNSPRLPTFFLQMAGLGSQGTRAHAVAKVMPANMADCVRPWFLIDQYTDVNHDNRYDAGDVYNSVTSYQLPRDLGATVTFHGNQSPSGYGQLDVGSGGADIQDAIEHCAADFSVTVGDDLDTKPGGTVGPERHGTDHVYAWDSGATWDRVKHTIENSCAPSCTCDGRCPYGGKISPRVVIVPVCSPLQGDCRDGGPNNGSITVTNILAFFLTAPYDDGDIHAILIGTSGALVSDPSHPTPAGSFLKTVSLIR